MRTKVLLGAAVVLMLIVSVAAIGSNMGFKISIPLNTGTSNYVSLPFYNSDTLASLLWADAGGLGAGIIVSKFDQTSGFWIRYASATDTDFPINPGECVNVQTSSTHNWIVVGSHNPGLSVPITTGTSNYVSVPYHETAATASALWTELGGLARGIIISRFNQTTGFWEKYASSSDPDFPITPGEGYNIQTAATFGWIPSHF